MHCTVMAKAAPEALLPCRWEFRCLLRTLHSAVLTGPPAKSLNRCSCRDVLNVLFEEELRNVGLHNLPKHFAPHQGPPALLSSLLCRDVLTLLFKRVGDVGLEIAPGNEVEDLSLVEEVGNPWTGVPVAREWTPLDPR